MRADANKKQLTLKIVVNKDNGFKSAAAQSIKEMLEKLKISVTVSALSEKITARRSRPANMIYI